MSYHKTAGLSSIFGALAFIALPTDDKDNTSNVAPLNTETQIEAPTATRETIIDNAFKSIIDKAFTDAQSTCATFKAPSDQRICTEKTLKTLTQTGLLEYCSSTPTCSAEKLIETLSFNVE